MLRSTKYHIKILLSFRAQRRISTKKTQNKPRLSIRVIRKARANRIENQFKPKVDNSSSQSL